MRRSVIALPFVLALACVDLSRPGALNVLPDGGAVAGGLDPDAAGEIDAPVEIFDAPAAAESDATDLRGADGGAVNPPVRDGSEADIVVVAGDPDSGPTGADADPSDVATPDGSLDALEDGGGDGSRESPPEPLTIDDFSDQDVARNALGGELISENQTLSLLGGVLSFVWDGRDARSQALAQNLKPQGCPADLSKFRFLTFRMRASAAGKEAYLVAGRANGSCIGTSSVELGSVTLATTMETYTIDLAATVRDEVRFFQWVLSADGTRYYLDDIRVVP